MDRIDVETLRKELVQAQEQATHIACTVSDRNPQTELTACRELLTPNLWICSDNLEAISKICSLKTVTEAVDETAPKRRKQFHSGLDSTSLSTTATTPSTITTSATPPSTATTPTTSTPPPVANENDVPEQMLMKIAFYHPRKSLKIQEFLVCGSHQLLALRDRLGCIEEKNFFQDLTSGTQTQSYFYIEGTFYRDSRNVSEYLDTLIPWIKKVDPKRASEVNVKDMTEPFANLKIQLNTPYLYYHHGGCEHQVMFTDIRLLQKHEVAPQTPLLCHENKKKRVSCQFCTVFTAEFVLHNNPRLPFNPCFFCKQCEESVQSLCRTASHAQQSKLYRYEHAL
eukprot:m.264299 g.264299  ORF g.264299 m.264299 type:complete len:340 (-) comp55384_c0_seq1:47-1066(-)